MEMDNLDNLIHLRIPTTIIMTLKLQLTHFHHKQKPQKNCTFNIYWEEF